MAKRSFRVFFTEHDNGKLSGVVIRRRTVLFDEPAPATWGDREEDVLAGLEPALTSAVASDGAERFLFDEELQLRRVAVEVRPKAAAGGAWVLGTRTIPVRIGFAAWAEKETWRIVVPRFGWTLALEDIDDAGDILRHAIFSAMLGDEPASVFDFRPARREWIVPWELPHLSRDDDDAEASADELIPPTVAAVAEDWTLKLRRKLAAPPVGDVPAGLALCAAVDRQPPRSILLVGESGVGKTSLLRRAARHLGEKSKGKDTVPRRLWATSASHITAGMTYLGMWQERCLTLARELGGTEDWLFVDRLVDLLAPQNDGASIADLIAPAVIAGEVRLVAEASESELARCRRKSQAFVDAFDVIRVDEPPADVVIEMIRAQQRRKNDEVEWHPAALRRAVALLGGFRRDQRFPGKAIGFVDWWNQDAQKPPAQVLPGDVATAYARWSGLPVELITDERPMGRADIAAALRAGVIGQDHACDVVARALARFKTGLDDPERPVASLLFVGPTGVGKTELAKATAEFLFGSRDRIFRIDLSEYKDYHSFEKLIGDPRKGTTGQLTDFVRKSPFGVILLDEFEKGHANIADLFLQVFDDGRLTDAYGETVGFQHTLLLLTSNVGSDMGALEHAIGFAGESKTSPERVEREVRRALEQHYRPEFLNRIDRVLFMRPLRREDLRRIARRELGKIYKREGLVERDLLLEVDDGVVDLMLDEGTDPKYGARPLKRAIEELLVVPLARALLGGADRRFQLLRVARSGRGVTLSFEATEASRRLDNLERRARVSDGEGGTVSLSLADVRSGVISLYQSLVTLERVADLAGMRRELAALEAREASPAFWEDAFGHSGMLVRRHRLSVEIRRLEILRGELDAVHELCEASFIEADDSVARELTDTYARLVRRMRRAEREIVQFDERDQGDARLVVTPAGALEGATSWALDLAKMYASWARDRGYDVRFETGDDGVTAVAVAGAYAYGYLRGEAGGHRLVTAPPEKGQRRGEAYLARVEVLAKGEEPKPIVRLEDISPIRSYDLWHSHGVRDRVTGHAEGDTRRVLSGKLDGFLEAQADHRASEKPAEVERPRSDVN